MCAEGQTLFSVLIANYNNAKYLNESIQSVINQTYKNWEIVFVDDASTDNSLEIVQQYIGNGFNIKLFKHESNEGVGATKDDCCKYASGYICGFLDPDDTIAKEALEIMVAAHQKNPDHSIIYSTLYYCDELLANGRVAHWVKQVPNGFTNLHVDMVAQFATFKKQHYLQCGGLDRTLTSAIDKYIWYRLEEFGSVIFIDKPLYYYRNNANGVSKSKNKFTARDNHIKIIIQARERRRKSGFKNISFLEYKSILCRLYLITIQEKYKFEGKSTELIMGVFVSFIKYPFKYNILRFKLLCRGLVK